MYLHQRSERPRAVAIPFHVSTKFDMPITSESGAVQSLCLGRTSFVTG
jgi:hypothetical protein